MFYDRNILQNAHNLPEVIGLSITLFGSITIFFGIYNIPWNIKTECGKYPRTFLIILLVPHNIIMDLKNVIWWYRHFLSDAYGQDYKEA